MKKKLFAILTLSIAFILNGCGWILIRNNHGDWEHVDHGYG